jgi:hypothetical protein
VPNLQLLLLTLKKSLISCSVALKGNPLNLIAFDDPEALQKLTETLSMARLM